MRNCVLILMTCMPLLASGQTFTDVTPANITAVEDGDVAWGDYDNDGYLDFAIAGRSNVAFAAIYKGAGNGTFQLLANHSIEGQLSCDLEWGDFDNDGDLDLAIFGNTGLVVMKNNLTTFEKILSVGITSNQRNSLTWFDYDNDGDLDLYARSYVYVNVNGQFPEVDRFRLKGSDRQTQIENTATVATDFDSDGDQDIFTSGKYYYGTWNECGMFSNNGVKAIELSSTSGLSYNDIRFSGGSINQGDFNKDGMWDYIITGNRTSDNVNSAPFSKLLTGNKPGNLLLSQSFVNVHNSSSDVGDIDNDGDLDIIISGTTGSSLVTRVFHNNGQGVFADANIPDLAALQHVAVRLGDYDNDGDLDILITGRNSSNAKVIKLYRNNLRSSAVLPNEKPTPPSNVRIRAEDNLIIMEWDKGTDKETPAHSLSYNIYAAIQTKKPFRYYTEANPETGKRLVARHGNASTTMKWVLNGLKTGTYRFAAQSIDGAYAGSAFSTEATFDLLRIEAEGSSCSFNEQSLSISRPGSYTWTVTGGTIVEGQSTNKVKVRWGNNPSVVKVTVTDGISSNSLLPVLEPAPDATIIGPLLVCDFGEYMKYNAASFKESLQYDWYIDGMEYKDRFQPTFYWSSPGLKPVSLEITDKISGCRSKGSIEVRVSERVRVTVAREGDVISVQNPNSSYSYKWEKYIAGAWIPVGDKHSYTMSSTGRYKISATNQFTCTSVHEFEIDNIITGLDETGIFSVFPNPTSTGFYITDAAPSYAAAITLSDLTGRSIKIAPIPFADGLFVDCAFVKPGVYLISIPFGDASIIRKLVIE